MTTAKLFPPGECRETTTRQKGPVSIVFDCTLSRHFVIFLHFFFKIRLFIKSLLLLLFFVRQVVNLFFIKYSVPVYDSTYILAVQRAKLPEGWYGGLTKLKTFFFKIKKTFSYADFL